MRIFLLALALVFGITSFADIVDHTVGAQTAINDTLLFRGIQGSEELNRHLARDLENCGWFDIVRNGVSNYVVSGSASGNSVQLDLSNGAGMRITTIAATGSDVSATSKRAVDALLKFLYKIPGICSTKIIFVAETGKFQKEIYMCDYDGANVTRLTANGGLSLDPLWVPGGRSIVYSDVGRTYSTLIELSLNPQRNRRLARFTGLNAGGRISPDGQKVALILSKDNQVDLYVRSVNGTEMRRLTNDKAVEASPAWSPDGKYICYVSDAGTGRPRLHIIPANGGFAKRVPGALGSESVSPSWSKDGKIAYSAKLGNYTVAIVDAEGKKAPARSKQQYGPLKLGKGDWESPSWAPDNRHVVCSRNYGIYVVDTWKGTARQILGGKSKLSLPDWSEILYY